MTEIKIFGEHDERTKAQMARCIEHGSVAGGVIAYEEDVSVSGVGFDIGCGNMAVQLDVPKAAIADRIGPLVAEIAGSISFGIGRTNAEKVEHELFDSNLWTQSDVTVPLKGMARDQLGTVGSGNHYVDLFA